MNFIKKILKGIVFLVVCAGLIIGSVVVVHHFVQPQRAPESDVYKEKTERDSSYNGIYTLTATDENGKNMWDGLICYVKNDKIVTGAIVEYESYEEIRDRVYPGEEIQYDNDEYALKLYGSMSIKIGMEGNIGEDAGFAADAANVTGSDRNGMYGFFVKKYNFENYNTKLDFNNMDHYNMLYNSGLLAGYDEDSNEIWLSKLINNDKSTFKDYKLIHYSGFEDMQQNCALDSGSCYERLNELYGINF